MLVVGVLAAMRRAAIALAQPTGARTRAVVSTGREGRSAPDSLVAMSSLASELTLEAAIAFAPAPSAVDWLA